MTDRDPSTALIAERLGHAITRLQSAIHMSDPRITSLEKISDDHEQRIRSATEGVTQFKAMITFISVCATLLSIRALIISWIK